MADSVRLEEPREATLGFALSVGADGAPRELSEPVVLATILAGVEAERTGLATRLGLGTPETVEAVANIYWPIAVLPSPAAGRIAVFDGTGVWHRTFRHSVLPPVAPIHEALAAPSPPNELLGTLRSLRPQFQSDPGAEVLDVEGFLPVDPPLLHDVLAQANFPREPQSSHPGFLPARHDYPWYGAAVDQMGRWLDRFDSDLAQLGALKAKVAGRLGEALVTVDDETAQVQREGDVHRSRARAELLREGDRLHAGVVAEYRREADVLSLAQATVAEAILEQRTADSLADRSVARGTDAAPHRSRARRAKATAKDAHAAIRVSLGRLEALQERHRSGLIALTGRATAVAHFESERLAGRELFRDELGAVAREVMDALDGHIASRRQQRGAVEQYFVPPTSLPATRVLWFPLWMALLRGPHRTRTLVFPPMRLRDRAATGSAFRALFGGSVLALEPRTELFEGALRKTLEDAVATDPWLARTTSDIVRSSDVLFDPDLERRLHGGLLELGRAGWLSPKAARRLTATYHEVARQRRQPFSQGESSSEAPSPSVLRPVGPAPVAA